jgi:hypothetical protein
MCGPFSEDPVELNLVRVGISVLGREVPALLGLVFATSPSPVDRSFVVFDLFGGASEARSAAIVANWHQHAPLTAV